MDVRHSELFGDTNYAKRLPYVLSGLVGHVARTHGARPLQLINAEQGKTLRSRTFLHTLSPSTMLTHTLLFLEWVSKQYVLPRVIRSRNCRG